MLATQMPDTPPEAKDVKQVKPLNVPYLHRSLISLFCLVVFPFTVTVTLSGEGVRFPL